MADDAPAGAGTDETAQHDSTHPGNGQVAGMGRDELPVADRTENGGGPSGGNGTAAPTDPDQIAGLTTGPLTTGPLTSEPLTTGSMRSGSLESGSGAEPLASDSPAAESLAGESLTSDSLASEAPAAESLASGSLAAEPAAAEPASVQAAATGPSPQAGDGAGSGPQLPAGAVTGSVADSVTDSVAGTDAAAGPDEPGSVGAAPADPAGARSKRTGDKGGRGSFWRELPVLIVIAVALAILIRTFLVQAFFIPSGSMEKTLHGCPGCSGDRVLVNKLVYDFRDPHPGDVVVFKGPPSWDAEVPVSEPSNVVGKAMRWVGQTIGVSQPDEKDFVKRVIAVGGQTVMCCDSGGRITVNGVPLDEPYVFLSNPSSPPQQFGPVTVPQGRLWVMGDHRDGSADSRAHIDDGTDGTVPVSDVIGKAFVIVWPPSRWNTLGTPGTFHSLSSGPLSVGAPMALGVIGTLPVAALRRRRRRRRRAAGG